MTKASASTDAMVTSGSIICLDVRRNTRPNRAGDMPSRRADRIAANKQAVPGAESQAKVYIAPYGDGTFTTGGIWLIWLCNAGQANFMVCNSRPALIGLAAHSKTKTTSRR